MEEAGEELRPVDSRKKIFDETTLTAPQRKAYEFAKRVGFKPRTLKELALDVEPELLDSLIETLDRDRKESRLAASKNPFEE